MMISNESKDSMIVGTFACSILFGLYTRIDNIRDYADSYNIFLWTVWKLSNFAYEDQLRASSGSNRPRIKGDF